LSTSAAAVPEATGTSGWVPGVAVSCGIAPGSGAAPAKPAGSCIAILRQGSHARLVEKLARKPFIIYNELDVLDAVAGGGGLG